MSPHPRLTLHEAGHGYIGRLMLSNDFLGDETPTKEIIKQNIFVLDRSGSMGQNVQRMASVVIPAVARRYLKLSSNSVYTLITFDSAVEIFTKTVEQFESSSVQARGRTCMAGVFDAIMQSLDASGSSPLVQIVAISDGCIHDTQQTLNAASIAASRLKGAFSISATAIRLFTSQSQPDTQALASILQLNTDKASAIVDIDAASTPEGLETNIEKIGAAIGCQEAGPHYMLNSTSPCLQQVPWASASTDILVKGASVEKSTSIWLASVPDKLTMNGVEVKVDIGERVTHDTLRILLEDKITFYLDQLRILKVLNSPSAKEELDRIVSYFRTLEESLPPPSDLAPLLKDRSLAGRAIYMKSSLARRVKSITNAMQSIANDQRVADLNLEQQADYLRQTGGGTSRCPRALARRAELSGMDFAGTMRAEVFSMAAHIDTLDCVDDSEHAISFYSQATTLEGIRCMVELANDLPVFNSLSASELLRLFNVVGIPAVGPVGDFPDPMTYRLKKLLCGTYVSVADITMALHQGGALKAPGQKEEIITAIPFFEDRRVQSFLQRHARSSLEYITSIGMRRMIAEVPKTYPYTICSGLWQTVFELNEKGKTEIRVKHFEHLVRTYEHAVEGHFDHILPLLKDNQNGSLSYYLGHNGITNMIAPMLHKIRHSEPIYTPRILRALYSFETYQIMRRAVREGGPNARQVALDEILGVEFSDERATALPPLFSRSEPQEHTSEAMINWEALRKYLKMMWFIPHATLLEPFFMATIHSKSPIQALQAIPPMSDESIKKALDLPHSMTLQDFLLYNVVESLLYGDKASRISKETNEPLLPDLGSPGAGADMIRTYIAARYAADYKKRLGLQFSTEQKILQDELVASMLSAEDVSAFEKCIQSGKKRGCASISIDRENSAGFAQVHTALMDAKQNVPNRAKKLYIIYSGRSPLSEDKKIFNGGNVYTGGDWKSLRTLLVSKGEEAVWNQLEHALRTRGHLYRGGSNAANRHGHSNDLKSYFAFGCQSLEQYRAMVSEESWSTYIGSHRDCCGVNHLRAKEQVAALSLS